MKLQRNEYAEAHLWSLPARTRAAICNLQEQVITTMQRENPGAWELGSNWDRHGRGWKTTSELIHAGKDFHSQKLIIILRIRQVFRKYRKGFLNQRRSYFLCSRNEDGSAFAHPVNATAVRSAINKGEDPIQAAQKWMFEGEYRQMIRQGDHALVAANQRTKDFKTAEPIEVAQITLQDSHLLQADQIKKGGFYYALNPRMIHLPEEHPPVPQLTGWYRISEARREDTYHFAPPSID